MLDSLRLSTDDFADNSTILDEQDSWHGRNLVLLSKTGQLVDINLDELGLGVLLGELGQDWGNHLTRTTPGGKEVDDNQTGVLQGLVELGFSVDWRYHY